MARRKKGGQPGQANWQDWTRKASLESRAKCKEVVLCLSMWGPPEAGVEDFLQQQGKTVRVPESLSWSSEVHSSPQQSVWEVDRPVQGDGASLEGLQRSLTLGGGDEAGASRENAELRTTLVENLCPNESPPFQGVQDSSGKGFVYQNGFAKIALELFRPHDPVVEFLMHLECRVVRI